MYEEIDTRSSHDVATGHIMIKCKSDCQKDVIEQLCSIEGIVEILEVIGEYDVLVKLKPRLLNL